MIQIPDLSVERARLFAIGRHANQRYGRHSYSVHLEQVYLLTVSAGLDQEDQVGSWLHDLIEDTDTTREEVSSMFGEEVGTRVWAVSGEGRNRVEKTKSILRKLDAVPNAINLKLADRLANISTCIRQLRMDTLTMYRYEHELYAPYFEHGHEALYARMLECLRISARTEDLAVFNSPGAYSIGR